MGLGLGAVKEDWSMRQRPLAAVFGSTVAIGLLLAAPRLGHASPQPSLPDATLQISTSGPPIGTIEESFPFNPATQEFRADASGTIGNMAVTFAADGHPDPSIAYVLLVDSNAIGARELFLRFRIPIAPLPEIVAVSSTLDVELVDENGGGAALFLVDPDPIQRSVGLVESSPGVSVARFLRVPLGTEDILTPGTLQFSAGPLPGPPPVGGDEFSGLEVRTHFVISPGDRVKLTGTVTAVPEPAATALLSALLIAWSFFQRRRTA
jgi:hypothetical protein